MSQFGTGRYLNGGSGAGERQDFLGNQALVFYPFSPYSLFKIYSDEKDLLTCCPFLADSGDHPILRKHSCKGFVLVYDDSVNMLMIARSRSEERFGSVYPFDRLCSVILRQAQGK